MCVDRQQDLQSATMAGREDLPVDHPRRPRVGTEFKPNNHGMFAFHGRSQGSMIGKQFGDAPLPQLVVDICACRPTLAKPTLANPTLANFLSDFGQSWA